MKLSYKIAALMSAVLITLPLTGCGDDAKNYRYNYDLSDYITLGEYKGIPAEAELQSVTDEDVQQQVMSTVLYFAQETEVDRASAKGDTVKFSCTAVLDGKDVAELAKDEGSLVLGFDSYGADADKALTGVVAGDTVTAERVLDAMSTTDAELIGKTVTYTFDVTGVFEMTPQEYNDIFVKAYFGYDTVADYEASIRASLEASHEQNYLFNLVSQTWPVLMENTTVLSYPEKELNQIVDQIISEVETYTAAVGIQFEEYTNLKYGMNGEEFRAYANTVAEEKVKEEMVIYAIARAEDIDVSDEVYDAYVQMYMQQLGFETPEELEARYTRGAICEGALGDLAKEFVARSAAVTAPAK